MRKLEPCFQEAVDAGGIDLDKVTGGLAAVLQRDGSAQLLLEYRMQPVALATAWREAHPDRWQDFRPEERTLYNAALDEAARYLVEVAAELPGFQSRFTARMVQELGSVADDVERILGKVDAVEAWVKSQGLPDATARYEADYRRAVLRRFDYMELLGADIPSEARRHPLSIAYVSLSLLAADESANRDPGDDEGVEISRPFDELLDELNGTKRRLLVRGEAGSGKSTLFRWCALQAARPGDADVQTPQRRGWRDCLPFLIRLRDCPQGKLPTVLELPREAGRHVGAPPEAWVKGLLDDGRALLLFDGVDEVPNDRRDDVRQEIEDLVAAYPGNFFLVSTRPAAVPPDWLAGNDFAEARINPMSETDRTRFVQKWHAAVYEQLRRDKRLSGGEELTALAERLTQKLRQHAGIARLATNPLLCGMICALHRERHEQLPKTQVELCEDLCRMLLDRRERESGPHADHVSPTYAQLTYDQKRAVVQELAHFMVRNGQSAVSTEEADGCFAEALARFEARTETTAAVRRALVERSGLLREPQPGRLDFVHNTLKEYLAGERFAHLGDTGQLVDHALDPAWQPSILFAAASRTLGFADRLIERLLASASNPLARTISSLTGWLGWADTLRARKLFAVRCGGDALHLSQLNRQKLNEIVTGTSRPLAVAEAEAFAALGNFVVPFLRYDPTLPARTAVACVRTMRLIGTDQARQCLQGYCDERRKTVVSELLSAVEPLELTVVQQQVRPIVEQDPQVKRRLETEPPADVLKGLESLDLEGLAVRDVTPLKYLTNLKRVNYTNSIGMRLACIPAGELLMGSPDSQGRDDERPQHRVRITTPFFLAAYPVTQAEYERVMGVNPSGFKGDGRLPVESVDWFDAVRFCNRLSEVEGREPYYRIVGTTVVPMGGSGYRLPTEAEWEYACRAGTASRWYGGNLEDDFERYAWFDRNSDGRTHPVGQKQPNAWGLHDMHGNVWEWCWDWYDEGYYAKSPGDDPQGPHKATHRVIRGGCWWDGAGCCRAAFRRRGGPQGRSDFLGFRVAATVPSGGQPRPSQ